MFIKINTNFKSTKTKTLFDIVNFINKISSEYDAIFIEINETADNNYKNFIYNHLCAGINNVTMLADDGDFSLNFGTRIHLSDESTIDKYKKSQLFAAKMITIDPTMSEHSIYKNCSFIASHAPNLIEHMTVKSNMVHENNVIVISDNTNVYLSNYSMVEKEEMKICSIYDDANAFLSHHLIRLTRDSMSSTLRCSQCKNRFCKTNPVDSCDVYFADNIESYETCEFFMKLDKVMYEMSKDLYVNMIINESIPSFMFLSAMEKVTQTLEKMNQMILLLGEEKYGSGE